ncbi:MAG: putative histidine kinase, hybrid [Planctomycetaceae bacterium]|nr:putative histidine kinase, hybrid [Planctomycetaceae bacterium]
MAELPQPAAPTPMSRLERACVLLVDDTPANLISLRAILEAPDYDLVEVRSGEEAVAQLKTTEFAVILLDVRMPGMNGFDTANVIRSDERSGRIPIIFLTADDIDRRQIEAGYALGAVDFLVKPLSPVVVQAKVRGFVTLFQEKQRARHEADQLRLLIQGTTDYAIFMLDPQGRVVTWNAGAERFKGYTAQEIIGQHFTKFYPQEAIDRGWPVYELKIATSEGRFEDEGWRVRKDGTQFWANVVITALRDEQGQLRGFSKVTRDLTERKRIEETLRRSEERFRLLVEGAKDYAIFLLDPQGHVASWNSGAERIKQYKSEEIIGQHFSRFYPQESLDRGWPGHELIVATAEGSFEDEGWRVRKDGTQFWANVVITALKDEHGQLLGFSKITRDMSERKLAEENARRLVQETAARQAVHQERERLHVTLASIGDAVISTDAQGRVEFLNPVAEEMVGWKSAEAAGRMLEDVFRIVNEDTLQPVENPALRALREGKVVGLANHTILISKDGTQRPIDDSGAPIRNQHGDISGSVLVFRDISERKQNEAVLKERMRLLALNASVGEALVQGTGLPEMLHRCAEALVKQLDGAFARIWTVDSQEAILELRASAGAYTHLDGPHSRVPVGKYKIGLIAQERKPHLTNAVVGDPRVSDQEWAQREGMVAFAGYPLLVDDRLVGVMAMFARHTLTEATLQAMASVADEIAVGIERKTSQDRLYGQKEWLRVTLASIGDAVIATDTEGCVTFLNPIAEELTGWPQAEAQGQPLESVFPIFNEQTHNPVQNPVVRVLREGVIVGLANHTILIARDGTPTPIDDSAAPIRDASGKMLGVVLIFRDVTEHRQAEQELRASHARKSAILETALDCIITMDHEGNVVEFNPAAERTFGYCREQVIGKQLADFIIPPSLRGRHQNGMTHYFATGDGPVLGKRLDLPALRADGTEFPIEIAITRIPTDGPPLFTAYLRDVSEHKRTEQHRNVRVAVTHVLSEAAGPKDGAAGLLRAVCENLGWDVGFYWNVDESATTVRCIDRWHRSDVAVAEFEADTIQRTFKKGEGLPGSVWSTGKPRWLLDVVKETQFPRAAAAAKYNLHSAFACPVTVGDRTLGVIEFFTKRIHEPDADLLEMMGTVAGNFGQFLERKVAEAQVRQSERELADFFENATVGLHWVGADGVILRANRTELELLGYSREEYVGRPIADFHADEATICDILARLQAGEELHEYPARLKCKDGTIKDVLIDSSVMFRDGEFVHTRCFTRDVTESKQSEAALREGEERLRLSLNAGRMGVWDWNIRTGDLKWSDSLEPLHGLAAGTFGGTFDDIQRLIHPDDREMVNNAIRSAVDEGTGYDIEFRNVWPNGSVHWIAGKGKVFPADDGQPGRMIGIGMDVTQRMRSEQTAQFLADASAAFAVLVDFDSTLQKVASLAVPYFADWATVDLVDADDTLRRVAVSHIDPAKIRLAHELHRRLPPDPAAPQGVWNIVRTGRSEIVAEITEDLLAQSVKDLELLDIMRELGLKSYIGVPLTVRGKTLGVITFIAAESGHRYDGTDLAVAEDLASRAGIAIENAQLYRELRDADRRKDEFLATLAHELRNPLAPIRNGLQVLKMSGANAEAGAEVRSIMERQLNQMVRLVDDLLDISRITRNKIDLKMQQLDVATIVHAAVETSRPLIEQGGHTFSMVLPATPVYVEGDLTRLAQVFSNLLNNSAKYTEPGGHISLLAEANDREVVVRVKDTGLGIPAESLPRIFEMFSQVERNMERSQGGLGIGLTLVQRLVEMHGGTVEAHSDGPGQGSEFTVRLPVLKLSQPTATTPRVRLAVETSKRRILVVDDNHDSAMSLAMMLKLMGNEIQTAHDGLAALEVAEQFRPDMILLDIGLPKLNGYDACRRIRQQPWSNGMVIVALTGWGQEEDRRRTREAGFNHHLVKPVEITALQTLLAER